MEFRFFPEQASTFAGPIDTLYFALVILSLVFAGIVPFVILYFIVKYHRSMRADRSNPVNSNLKLELAWSIGPFILAMGIFIWSSILFFQLHAAPANTLEVYVIGKRWMWHAQHPNGKRENNELHVPLGQPVKLIMISQDVIHSFYVPEFRVKQDVLPGRYTTMWFEATKEGTYHLFCAEYCGTEHSMMGGRVVVLSMPEYQRWLSTDTPVIAQDGGATAPTDSGASSGASNLTPLAAAGQQIFQQRGCVACHRSGGVGPELDGLFGSTVQFADNSTATADENYIRQAILEPNAQIVAGYSPVMPSFQGQLSEEELVQLVEYIKSLSSANSTQGAP